MTGDYFLYLENSFYISNGERNQVRDRMIPMSQIKRMWVWNNYFMIAQNGYDDLHVEKLNSDETLLDFYKRAYVPIPSQIVIDSNT